MSKLYNFIYKWNLDYFHQQQYAEAWIERNIHDITVRDMWLFGFVAVLACVIVCFIIYIIFKELRYIKKGGVVLMHIFYLPRGGTMPIRR